MAGNVDFVFATTARFVNNRAGRAATCAGFSRNGAGFTLTGACDHYLAIYFDGAAYA